MKRLDIPIHSTHRETDRWGYCHVGCHVSKDWSRLTMSFDLADV